MFPQLSRTAFNRQAGRWLQLTTVCSAEDVTLQLRQLDKAAGFCQMFTFLAEMLGSEKF